MSDIAIRVENLSKLYRIGAKEEQPRSMGQAMRSLVASPFAYLQRMRRPPTEAETLWALRDVSFEVKHGEVLGIIGRNGAGKSTLLKILSRITEPSSGQAQVFGRVGSLLEVGTGFHPELTGRENVYLNGAILGMKRSEIDRKFDEIVDFSGVERFLDTPVKRYSSGMYVRLAFAVAAHLEPEVLIIDEVLAVGDAPFQKKCLGKMENVAREGRTVLFVSHNMAAIQSLCGRALLLDAGHSVGDGDVDRIVSAYLHGSRERSEQPVGERQDRHGDGLLRFTSVSVLDEKNLPSSSWPCGLSGYIVLNYESELDEPLIRNAHLGFSVNGRHGEPLFQCWTKLVREWPDSVPAKGAAVCFLPSLNLKPGVYTVNLYAEVNDHTSDWLVDAAQLVVVENDYFGSGRLPEHSSAFLMPQTWQVANNEEPFHPSNS